MTAALQETAGARSARPIRDIVPMSLADLMDEAFDLYKRNFAALAGAGAVMQVPMQLLLAVASLHLRFDRIAPAATTSQQISSVLIIALEWVVVWGVCGLLFAVQSGALTVMVSERYLGRAIPVADAYRRTLPALAHVLLAWLIVMIAVAVVAGVACMFFGMFFAAILSAARESGESARGVASAMGVTMLVTSLMAGWPVAYILGLFVTQIGVVEDIGGRRAISRSLSLMGAQLGRAIWAGILVPVVMGVLTLAFTYSIAMGLELLVYPWVAVPSWLDQALSWVIVTGVILFVLPLWTVFTTLLYYDHRVRREGLDLALLEGQMAVQEAQGRPA